jgi:poly-gamma-glutamate synthesis protein (capsule biosynthesis protein)
MSNKREMTMLIVGDVFVLRDDPPSVFKHVKDLMRSADFMLGNLEGSACDTGKAVDKLGAEAWKADARQLSAIEAAGFHAVNVANNHMMDFGPEAMLATVENLDRIGIKHCGGGRNLEEAHAPAIIEHDGCKVAMLGYTCVFMDKWAARSDSPGLAVVGARTSYEPPKRVSKRRGRRRSSIPGRSPSTRRSLQRTSRPRAPGPTSLSAPFIGASPPDSGT